MQATSAAEALAYLARRLAELEAGRQGYKVQIYGKGKAITVEVTEIARFGEKAGTRQDRGRDRDRGDR